MMTSNVAAAEPTTVVEEPLYTDALKVSWGSIIAGLVVALGTWVLLSVLGLAIGLSSVDPTQPETLRSGGMVSGIWSLIVPFVALLVGGLVAARTAGVVTRPTGAIHGVVLWALATMASLLLVGYVVRGVVRTSLGATAEVATAAGSAGSRLTGGAMDTLGIRSDDLLGPVNERLRAEGKPTVTATQLDGTLREIAGSAVREGRLDRDIAVTALARNTRLSRADAEDITTRIETSVGTRADELRRDVATGTAKAADTTGKAMWWVFLGMLLGLGSAVVGSTLGVSRRQRLAATTHRTIATTTPAHSHS